MKNTEEDKGLLFCNAANKPFKHLSRLLHDNEATNIAISIMSFALFTTLPTVFPAL